ncbi:hypothetical protein EMIT043CA1_50284 [Pseudomonas brassicacearum]
MQRVSSDIRDKSKHQGSIQVAGSAIYVLSLLCLTSPHTILTIKKLPPQKVTGTPDTPRLLGWCSQSARTFTRIGAEPRLPQTVD